MSAPSGTYVAWTGNPSISVEAESEVDFEQLKLVLASSSKPGVSDPDAKVSKTVSKKSGKHAKSSAERKEERYLNRILKVERALVRAEKGKKRKKAAAKKKGGKQPKGPPKKKKSKSKSKAPTSSDDDSSGSSSSSISSSSASESAPINRIPLIPTGRLLQQCAMSRMNELNLTREPDVKLTEITEALQLIDTFELNISPQMACRYFYQVPGTNLPHTDKHVVSFGERYGALVRAVVKFHLLLIQKALMDKKAAINADQNSPLFLLWQFQNDLARAPSTSSYMAPPPVAASPLSKTPLPRTPKSKHGKKSKKSGSKTSRKVGLESTSRGHSVRKSKHVRSGKKSKGSKKKKRRNESSSEVCVLLLLLTDVVFCVLARLQD